MAAQSQDAGGTHNAAAGTADAQGANAVAVAGLSSGAASAQAEAVAPRSAQAGAEAVVDDGPKGRAREALQGGTVHGAQGEMAYEKHGKAETHATRHLRDGNGVEAAQATHARSIPTAADIGPCDGTHWSTSHSRTGAAEHARRWAGAAAVHEHLMDEHSLEAYDEPTLTVAVAAAVGRRLVVLPDMMRAAAAPAKAHKESTNTEMSMIPSRKFNMRQVTRSNRLTEGGRVSRCLAGREGGGRYADAYEDPAVVVKA
ncbi:hypothetical protein GGF50DRAFT_87126 [Schizophyllum commune]